MGKKSFFKKRTFDLAIPIFFQSVFQSLFSTADTFMLSKLSDQAVAAIGIANSPLELISKIFQMVSLGLIIIIPQLLGNNEREKANEISAYGILISLIIGVFASCFFCVFSKDIVHIYKTELGVAEEANIYLKIVGVGLVFQSLMIVLTAIIQSYEKAKVSMYVSVLANIVNIGIDTYVIFFIHPSQNTGIMCVALSTSFSQFLALYYYILNR